MINRLVPAFAAATLALPALGVVGPIAATSLPAPGSTGSLTVVRLHEHEQDRGGLPATAVVAVTACLLTVDADNNPLDLTTNLGWVRAAQITMDAGATLAAASATCITQNTVDGETTFTGLEIGLWHVSMVYADGEDVGETASEPFMTPIPRWNDEDQAWDTDIRAYPKAPAIVEPGNRAALRGTVWRNYANDGTINAGESRVPGVRVSVYSIDTDLPGCPLAAPAPAVATASLIVPASVTPVDPACLYYRGSVMTDANGEWVMRNLPAGQKVVRFLTQYAGPHYVFASTGPDFDGADPATGLTNPVTAVYDEYAIVNAGLLFTGPVVSPSPTPSPAPSPAPTPPSLPVTGAQIAGLVVAAAGLVGAGFLFLLGRKRKDAADA